MTLNSSLTVHDEQLPTEYFVLYFFAILFFPLQYYRSEAWFELNKEQINAARTVQVIFLLLIS